VLGYWLGQFAFVKANIEFMIIAIVIASILPMVVEIVRARRRGQAPDPV
jgi:membrane-associated protein